LKEINEATEGHVSTINKRKHQKRKNAVLFSQTLSAIQQCRRRHYDVTHLDCAIIGLSTISSNYKMKIILKFQKIITI